MPYKTEKLAKGVRLLKYDSGKKSYQIEFVYRGTRCRETLKIPVTKTNNRYAANLKAEILNAIERDTFRYTDYFPHSKRAVMFGHAVSTLTVEELLTEWVKDIERSHPHSTARKYRMSAESVLIPALGHYRASDLAMNPQPIRDLIRSRNVTLKTIRNDLTPLRAVFDQAVADNLIDRNPMDRIKVAKLIDRRVQSSYKVDPYSTNEILQIINTAKQHRPEWSPYFQFIFFSGVRTSEGYALKWSTIDWQRQKALIDLATVERQEKETKTTSSEREMVLIPMAMEALKQQRCCSETWCEYIFVNPRTKKQIIDYEETAAVLKYLCRKSGIRFRQQRQTRHSFASNLLSGGENPYRVAEMMGHKNVEMVFKIYGKWIDQGKDKAQEFVSEFANIKAQNANPTPIQNTDASK